MGFEQYFFWSTILLGIFILFYAYQKNKIDFSALLGSGVVGTIVILTLEVEWVYLLLGFFVFGNLVSRYRYEIKEKEDVAEGIRTFKNVFGNGGSAIIFALFYFFSKNPIFLFAFTGAMATASADTFATEIGEAHEKKPRLITKLRKRVKIGTPGAVSLPGLLGSIIGSLLISGIPLFFHHSFQFLLIGTIAGIFGCKIDSLLGATIEREKIDKHMTNFLATLAGGVTAIILFYFLGNNY